LLLRLNLDISIHETPRVETTTTDACCY